MNINIPNNATNGDVIKTLFPNAEIEESHKDIYGIPHIYMVYKLDIYPTSFTSDFWNAPYKLSELKGENKECPYFDYEIGTCRRSERQKGEDE